jgi:hypothetical protein
VAVRVKFFLLSGAFSRPVNRQNPRNLWAANRLTESEFAGCPAKACLELPAQKLQEPVYEEL